MNYRSASSAASPLLLKPPLIITNRFTSSGRWIATSIAEGPSLCPTRSADFPTTVSKGRWCPRSSAGR